MEAYALREGSWVVIGLFQEDDTVRVAPFEELALNLAALWVEKDAGEEPAA